MPTGSVAFSVRGRLTGIECREVLETMFFSSTPAQNYLFDDFPADNGTCRLVGT